MVKNTKNETIIQIPYAGLTRNDVSVKYQNGTLTIKRAKNQEGESGRCFYGVLFDAFLKNPPSYGYIGEHRYNVSEEYFDVDKISAEMSHGLLTITLPYKNLPEARRIEIK